MYLFYFFPQHLHMLRVFFLLFEAAEHIQEETASDPLWCHPCGPSLPLCLGSWASRQQVSPHLPLVQSNPVRCEAAGWSLDCSSKEMCFKLYCWHAVFCPTSFCRIRNLCQILACWVLLVWLSCWTQSTVYYFFKYLIWKYHNNY